MPFNCIAGRFDVSGGVASLRRLVVDTPRATLVGGGYVHLRSEGWEFILAPEARDNQNAALASPLRLKGGSGRQTAGALEPSLAKLIVPGGGAASLVAQINQAARQAGANPCAVVAPRVEGLRPGLARADAGAFAADLRQRPAGPRRRPRRRSPASSAEPIGLPKRRRRQSRRIAAVPDHPSSLRSFARRRSPRPG